MHRDIASSFVEDIDKKSVLKKSGVFFSTGQVLEINLTKYLRF